MAMSKPSRISLALLLLFIFYIVTEHSNNAEPVQAPLSQFPTEQGDDSAQDPGGFPPGYVEDAHRLASADEFLPHFKAVTEMKGLTMAEAKAGCQWKYEWAVNFQFSPEQPWAKRDTSDREIERRRMEWHYFIENGLLPYDQHKDKFNGRGIVIVAGNQESMRRVRVILKSLEKVGSKLPVELHYWDNEMTEESKNNVSALWPEMYFNDLSADKHQNILKTSHNGPYINYQLKTAAVMNSRFAEPLLIDSDNIPVIDPEELYESETYQEYGTLFWPDEDTDFDQDIARTRPQNPIWPITNTKCRMDEYEQESGQIVIDKRRFFYHLQFAAWLNNEKSDYYGGLLLGDKDTFRFAWHALNTKYGFPPKWLTSVGTVAPNGKYCGHTFAQHHPDGRIAFLHGGLVKAFPKVVLSYLREHRGGMFQSYKRFGFDERHDAVPNVAIKWDGFEYVPGKPRNFLSLHCTDMSDVEPRPLDELLPGFEQTYKDIGGYWALDDVEHRF